MIDNLLIFGITMAAASGHSFGKGIELKKWYWFALSMIELLIGTNIICGFQY